MLHEGCAEAQMAHGCILIVICVWAKRAGDT